ncbi:MAG: urease accessory protein UreD [Steroidobacteraceae bacterium]
MSAAPPLSLIDPPRSATPWNARLDLRFERRGEKTVLTHNEHAGPLQVQKSLFPEGAAICHLAVLHPPGGIAGGDRLIVDARLGAGAHALLTTPGASKWYRSPGPSAEQQLRFCVSGAAVLEWLPRETIFFDGSRAAASLDVDLGPAARFFGWEILCFGRRASGEQWRAGSIASRSRISIEGRLIWAESANLLANSGFFASPVGLAGCSVSGTFLAAGFTTDPRLLAACRAAGDHGGADGEDGEAQRGITALPQVLVARFLGHSSEQAFRWFRSLWAQLRPAVLGSAAQAPRLWAT